MSKVLLIHQDSTEDAVIATSLVKKMTADGNRVSVLTRPALESLFQYSGAYVADRSGLKDYDILINMSPDPSSVDLAHSLNAHKKLGYSGPLSNVSFFNDGTERHYLCKVENKNQDCNQFQLVYGLGDFTWQGEGYGVGYFPRNKTRKSLTGVATRNIRLRSYLFKNLDLQKSRLWQIPFKRNILKQLDEINRCKQIVTDDFTTLHLALALRKTVEFVFPKEPNYNIEFFGSGSLHIYDYNTVKLQQG